uniref:Polyadenylate-binding protein n=1 Tax=Anthurium amnicola TaxID=1678845 RepID=A0A1D1XFF2_9ARAE
MAAPEGGGGAQAVAATAVPASASLYVGDLRPDVTEGQLLDVFAPVGGLASVRVCRDSATGASLGYAYVNFVSPDDAIRAMETLNHTAVGGKPIRIMWSHRDPDARKSGIGNLFVKNLSESIDNVKLQEIFSKFGKILSCKVASSHDGKSKCYGFVQFESQESANSAIETLHGSDIEGKQIYVTNFIKKSERVVPSPDAKYTNLYMKNLDQDITEELLQLKFSEFGKITSLSVAQDTDGNSRGFGFVNFESPDDAKRAMETMNGMQLGCKVLYVARAQKKAEREEILRRFYEERRSEIRKNMPSNVYIKNIHDSVGDDDLREHFSVCGTVTSAKVMRDDKGMSKGFGFVCFSSTEEANKAVNSLHGYIFHGKPLYVAIAQRKEERQAQLQLHYAQQMGGLAGSSSAVFHAGYPPVYYPPPGVISQVPPRQGLMYRPVAMRPGWTPNGFIPFAKSGFQPMSLPTNSNVPRHHRQARGRMSGNMLPPTSQYAAHVQPLQPNHSTNVAKESNNQQRGRQGKYMPNGPVNNGSGVLSAASNSGGMEMLSSMLAAATPQQQKQMLGEHLFPLVQKHKSDLAAKITGMLLEMDNSELLLLLESPESLVAKVDEAVQVLKLSKAKVGSHDALHSSFLSSEVAVN